MPGPGESSYNSWGSAGGLPPLGSLTLNYSVTIPNSNDFPDESDSGTARTGNQVGARSAATQFRLGAQYSDAFSPEQFDDAPYVPPRSGQSLPNPYTVHTSHSPHAHTRTHGIPSVSILTRHLNISSFLILFLPCPVPESCRIPSECRQQFFLFRPQSPGSSLLSIPLPPAAPPLPCLSWHPSPWSRACSRPIRCPAICECH